jgi:hypothetical protein
MIVEEDEEDDFFIRNNVTGNNETAESGSHYTDGLIKKSLMRKKVIRETMMKHDGKSDFISML